MTLNRYVVVHPLGQTRRMYRPIALYGQETNEIFQSSVERSISASKWAHLNAATIGLINSIS